MDVLVNHSFHTRPLHSHTPIYTLSHPPLLPHSRTHPRAPSFTHSFTHKITHSYTPSFTHSCTPFHPFLHTLSHTHHLTHLLSPILAHQGSSEALVNLRADHEVTLQRLRHTESLLDDCKGNLARVEQDLYEQKAQQEVNTQEIYS